MRTVVRPHAHGSSTSAAEVAGAVADQRQRLLGQRGEDELALGAGRDQLPVGGVDHLDEEVVLLTCSPSRTVRHSVATPGPHISDRP